MTGLEKIISQIESDSNNRCRETIQKAENEAKQIIEQAEKLSSQRENEENENALKYLSDAKSSAISSAQLKKNQIVLSKKLSIIDETLIKALEVIKGLPKKEYFDILKELAIKNSLSGEGVLMLSKEDKERIPQGFIDSINSNIKEKGKSISLGECADIDSGFLLIYGDIDINCTFSSIISSKKDEIRDALNSLLFC